MKFTLERLSRPARGAALAGVVTLGLLGIVGSGGGISIGIGFPIGPDCPYGSCDNPPPPQPSASVAPARQTALVGTPASFAVATQNITDPTFQWRRSADGGQTYADIVGATGPTHTVPRVNLTDDGTRFQVLVRGRGGVSEAASAWLAVSAVPALVLEDTTFAAGDWVLSTVPDPQQLPFRRSADALAAGGNPGAYLRLSFEVPFGAGSARAFFVRNAAPYLPAAQGALHVVDYSEDCATLQGGEFYDVHSGPLLEQGGRVFVADAAPDCRSSAWTRLSVAALGARDFRQMVGPPCAAGQACPDFSASAAPLRFGFWRIAFDQPGQSGVHGIDNWRVLLWRR